MVFLIFTQYHIAGLVLLEIRRLLNSQVEYYY